MIKTEVNGAKINFYSTKGKYLGFSYREVDGYYVFCFDSCNGFWSDYVLRAIADKLTSLNADWNTKLTKEFT